MRQVGIVMSLACNMVLLLNILYEINSILEEKNMMTLFCVYESALHSVMKHEKKDRFQRILS